MKSIKRLLLIFGLMVFCSIAAFAQSDKDGKKKDIPKPNPPVVIVNLDKKDDKKKPENKGKKKPNAYIIGFLKKL